MITTKKTREERGTNTSPGSLVTVSLAGTLRRCTVIERARSHYGQRPHFVVEVLTEDMVKNPELPQCRWTVNVDDLR